MAHSNMVEVDLGCCVDEESARIRTEREWKRTTHRITVRGASVLRVAGGGEALSEGEGESIRAVTEGVGGKQEREQNLANCPS